MLKGCQTTQSINLIVTCADRMINYPLNQVSGIIWVHEFHITIHLLCWASGGGATVYPMSFTWASHVAASVLTGRTTQSMSDCRRHPWIFILSAVYFPCFNLFLSFKFAILHYSAGVLSDAVTLENVCMFDLSFGSSMLTIAHTFSPSGFTPSLVMFPM